MDRNRKSALPAPWPWTHANAKHFCRSVFCAFVAMTSQVMDSTGQPSNDVSDSPKLGKIRDCCDPTAKGATAPQKEAWK